MKIINLKIAILFTTIILASTQIWAQNGTSFVPKGLMCDLISANYHSSNGYLINQPLSTLPNQNIQSVKIFNKAPAFSWAFDVESKNLMQTAYQILVSDNLQKLDQNIGNVWDSEKVKGDKSASVLFGGKSLRPNTHYYWKVRVWNSWNEIAKYSSVASFLTGEELSDYKNPAYPLQITEQKPLSLVAVKGVYKADFGKDAFAQLKLDLFSKTGDDTVIIHLGEILDMQGNIDRKPPGTIRYAQYPLVLQKGAHTYKLNIQANVRNTKPSAIKMPNYVGEVLPFRYCEIEGYGLQLHNSDLTRLFVHYKFNDENSDFHSSDSTLNAIWDLCKYSIKATSFLGIYVDGDRERIPYEADAYINQLSHYAVDKEFTMARNSHEYLITHPTWPTEWHLQSVLMAWNDYLYSGDIRSVSHYYKALQAKTLLSLSDSTGLISTKNGKLTDEVKASIHLGSGNLKDIVDWPRTTETDGFVFTKYNAVVNAFHYRALVVMGKIAKDLGKISDAEMYSKRAASVKQVFQKVFFDTKRNIFVDGIGTDHASLHTNAFALALGLVDLKHKKSVIDFIRSRGMACSVYGSQFLLDGLYDANEDNYALSLLLSRTDRSWFNMLKVGSTITLEAWDNKYKPNQDWNHAWGAAPANIISRKLMGIEPTSPGWSTFLIKPQIGELEFASISVPTIKGQIRAVYKQTASSFEVLMEIPANTSSNIQLPIKNGKKYQVFLNETLIKITKVDKTILISNLGSGKQKVKIIYDN